MNERLYSINPDMVSGIDAADIALMNELLQIWQLKLPRNLIRDQYYRMHNKLKDLDISIPPQLKNTVEVIGWPEKAVDKLADRSKLKGFFSQGEANPDLDRIMDENDIAVTYAQTVTSELVSSCAFMTVTKGIKGEPDVIVTPVSALNSSALWDFRKKRIRAGLAVVDMIERGDGTITPTWVDLYTDTKTVTCRRHNNGRWTAETAENLLGRPLMEPFVYHPSIDRPFGKSRISRAVMSITDNAVRNALRTEVSAEFNTSPQKYLLGADKGTFAGGDKAKAEAYLNLIFAVTPNKNGDIPTFGQLPQVSMQPHTEYTMALAKQFSGETGIPVGQLGVVQDNPASAEAMYAAETSLIVEAETLNERNGRSLRNVARMALAAYKNTTIDTLEDIDYNVNPSFENPQRPSMAARADFALKVASIEPLYAKTDAFWDDLGYSEADARAIKAQIEREDAKARVQETMTRIAATRPVINNLPASDEEDVEVVDIDSDEEDAGGLPTGSREG